MEATQPRNEVLIKKASGNTEAFDVNKLKNSLRRSGAGEDIISQIVSDIEAWVYDGVSTGKIYNRAYKLLRQMGSQNSHLYKLKMAINSMGPSGHPFEQFIGELFKLQGYEVQVAQVLEGAAITHEMDIIATKDGMQILMECKFSQLQGHSVSIQVPLYVHSRVEDIVEKRQQDAKYQGLSFRAGVVTNGRFSPDSIRYSIYKGIKLLGWDYPRDNALRDLVERARLFPVTILSSLTLEQKRALMREEIVTCAQLQKQTDILEALGLSKSKQASVIRELETLLR